ncbi:MAG: zinc-ribbon domain containing protein [Alphaproteobacteria bacterium]|nr:zinc-ribbon domain containing protein [Alphaproteobacteria bacterium]
MWEIIVGGAALLIGGAYVLCSVLEEENERSAQELDRRTRSYENELKKREQEIARIRSLNNKTEALTQLQQEFLLFKQKSDEAHQIFVSGKEYLYELNEQIKQAFEYKNKLKEDLGKEKKHTAEFEKKLQCIKEYGAFIQSQIRLRDEQKQRLDIYHNTLQELNNRTKYLNNERKSIREENADCFQCSDCGATFYIKTGELLFYKKKGLSYPKRCPSCRSKKRLNS